MNRPFSRRALLAAAGSSLTLTLPALTARAQAIPGGGAPRRLLVVVTPNGYLRDAWLPASAPSSTALQPLGRTMQPLVGHALDLVLVDGLENRAAPAGGDPASGGMATLLTGTEPVAVSVTGAPPGGGISLDQKIALRSGRMPVVVGISTTPRPPALCTPSYVNATKAAGPSSLADALAQVYAGGSVGPDPEVLQRRAANQAGLSATQRNLAFLRAHLGKDEALRLEAHEQYIRELQRRINIMPATCPAPAPPPLEPVALLDAGRWAMDLVVQAFACDLTRVATLVYEGADGNVAFAGDKRGHHDLAIAAATDAGARAALAIIETQFMAEFNRLLDKLAAVPDGTGTLLDNTLVLWCSDVASASPRSWKNMPCLLAGRAGGMLATGRLVRAPGASWNQLLSSIDLMFGGDGKIGNPMLGAGPLPGL